MGREGVSMKIGKAGDGLSLARVIIAMAVGAIVLGGAGYLFDRAIGPMIEMNGWWTVTGSLGLILGGMFQAAREWAIPQPDERRAVAARLRARAAAEEAAEAAAEAEAKAGDTDTAPVASAKTSEPAAPAEATTSPRPASE
jgi:hypothetical protein